MKWDIDKALKALEDGSRISGTTVSRIQISGEDHALKFGIRFTAAERERGCAFVWCLALGIIQLPKLFFYDREIHGAYIKAKKAIKNLSDDELLYYALRKPRRSNSFMAAKSLKKRKPKAPSASV